MPALSIAGLLALLALAFSVRALQRCRRLVAASATASSSEDELEARLALREQKLELGLANRNVQAIGRAALFGGTGAAVWELSAGSAHYVFAGAAFGFGLLGWMGSGEVRRRIGSLAGSARRRR